MTVETKHEFKYGDCALECTKYDHPSLDVDVSLTYTEHSPDSWYPDNETSVTIKKAEARELIKFLQESFDI